MAVRKRRTGRFAGGPYHLAGRSSRPRSPWKSRYPDGSDVFLQDQCAPVPEVPGLFPGVPAANLDRVGQERLHLPRGRRSALPARSEKRRNPYAGHRPFRARDAWRRDRHPHRRVPPEAESNAIALTEEGAGRCPKSVAEKVSKESTMTQQKILYTAKAHTTGNRDGAARSD